MKPQIIDGIGFKDGVVNSITIVKFEMTSFLIAVTEHVKSMEDFLIELLNAVW